LVTWRPLLDVELLSPLGTASDVDWADSLLVFDCESASDNKTAFVNHPSQSSIFSWSHPEILAPDQILRFSELVDESLPAATPELFSVSEQLSAFEEAAFAGAVAAALPAGWSVWHSADTVD